MCRCINISALLCSLILWPIVMKLHGERATVLDINSNDRQGVNLEAWYIRLKKAEMNSDVGTLSMDYDCLIRLEQKKNI